MVAAESVNSLLRSHQHLILEHNHCDYAFAVPQASNKLRAGSLRQQEKPHLTQWRRRTRPGSATLIGICLPYHQHTKILKGFT
jgi:hypothetical protein